MSFYVSSLLMTRRRNVDSIITENSNNLFGNLDAYNVAFPNGIAGAYRDYMTNTIQPQINRPSQYLTSLWVDVIWADIQNAFHLPDVGEDRNNPNNPGQYYDQWLMFFQFAQQMKTKYYVNNVWTWEYDFRFSWDCTATPGKRSVCDNTPNTTVVATSPTPISTSVISTLITTADAPTTTTAAAPTTTDPMQSSLSALESTGRFNPSCTGWTNLNDMAYHSDYGSCLFDLKDKNWGTYSCAGKQWVKQSNGFYQDPTDCWSACSRCMAMHILGGQDCVSCEDLEGDADCTMTYGSCEELYPPEPNPFVPP